ncbi:MAG: hypothetical protein KAS32_26335 [Candidatus Peribacteraceae bacterium]|nr:hypothetical protein [Candidatus Peribacteraceae bacterium]
MGTFKLEKSSSKPVEPYQPEMEFGVGTFVTTGLTVEIRTEFDVVLGIVATPKSYTGSAAAGAHVMFSDLVVTAGAVTLARKVSADSGMQFSYVIYGQKITV